MDAAAVAGAGAAAATVRRSSASVGSGGDPESLERPLLTPPHSPSHPTRRQLHSLFTARPPRDYDGEEDLIGDLNGAEEGGRPGIGGGDGGARRSSHRGASMLRRVAPVMAVSCAAGVANYGLCVPAYTFAAELLAESTGYPNLPTMVNVVYYVATPVGFGMAGVIPGRAAYPIACVAWVLAIGFVLWTGVSARSGGGGGGDGYERMAAAAGVGSGLGLLTGDAASDGGGGDGGGTGSTIRWVR